MADIKQYEMTVNGQVHTFQVADGDDLPVGARLVESKQAKPANKARTVSNKEK